MGECAYILACDADGCLYNKKKFTNILIQFINANWDFVTKLYLPNDEAAYTKSLELLHTISALKPQAINHFSELVTCPQFKQILAEAYRTCPGSALEKKQASSKALADVLLKSIRNMDSINQALFARILIQGNKNLIAHVKQKKEELSTDKMSTLSASNRQSHAIDLKCNRKNGTKSFFISLNFLAEAVGSKLSKFCMADIFGNLKRGRSYERILKEYAGPFSLPHAKTIFDETKVSLLYAIAHDACCEVLSELGLKNDAKVNIDFVDDRKDILIAAYDLYKNNPQLLPSQVTLHFVGYNGVVDYQSIQTVQGTGLVDINYAKNIKLMMQMSSGNALNYTGAADVAKQLNVAKFISERDLATSVGLQTLVVKHSIFSPNIEEIKKDNALQKILHKLKTFSFSFTRPG